MANVYATLGANGVECTPIAITKGDDRSGSDVKVAIANCHQAINKIAQTCLALSQRCRGLGRRCHRSSTAAARPLRRPVRTRTR